MREAYKEYPGDSGPNFIVDLDGPDGNVFALWGILQQFANLYSWEDNKGDMIEESKHNGHIELPHDGSGYYKGYEGVLDYCLHHLSPSPAAVEFRMYGHEVGQVSDYQYALTQGLYAADALENRRVDGPGSEFA